MKQICKTCGDEIHGPVRIVPETMCAMCAAWFRVNGDNHGHKIILYRVAQLEKRIDALLNAKLSN